MNEKSLRKHCTIRTDPQVLRKVREEALHSKKTMGQWLEEIVEEHVERQNRVKSG